MSEQADLLTRVYEEGYAVGNACMSATYMPYKYQQDSHLASQWKKGWKKGVKDAGLRSPLKKAILMTIVSLLIMTSIFVYIQNSFQPNDPLPIASIVPDSTKEADTVVPTTTSVLDILDIPSSNSLSVVAQIPVDSSKLRVIESTLTSITNLSQGSEIIADTTENKKLSQTPTTNSLTETKGSKNISVIGQHVFAQNVTQRNPSGILVEQTPYMDTLFFFTKLENALGVVITHSWYYEDTFIAQKTFKEIQGNIWRLHSQQSILPQQLGKWTVKVTDAQGKLYAQSNIIVE